MTMFHGNDGGSGGSDGGNMEGLKNASHRTTKSNYFERMNTVLLQNLPVSPFTC